MECEKLFFYSLIWSSISELETDSNKKYKLLSFILNYLKHQSYDVINLFGEHVNKDETKYLELHNSYKICYDNSLSINQYLQTGRYEREFNDCQLIGKGGFGHVYRAYNKFDKKYYAVKRIRVMENIDKDIDNTLREINIWSKLESEYVVQYKCAWFENMTYKYDYNYDEDDSIVNSKYKRNYKYTLNRTLFIQMELCETTLDDLMQEINKEFNQSDHNSLTAVGIYISSQLFLEIVSAVNYLHSQTPPLIHRDIKPQNILVKQHSNGDKFIKISDFGLTTYHTQTSMTHTSRIGSPEYIAPEVLQGRKYNEKSDVYSIGVVMLNMFLIKKEKTKGILSAMKNRAKIIEDNESFDEPVYPDEIVYPELEYRIMCRKINEIRMNIIALHIDNPNKRPNLTEIINNVNNYCLSFDIIKRCEQLTNIYYIWSENLCIGSKLLNKILHKYLKIDLIKKESDSTTDKIIESNLLTDFLIETNIKDEEKSDYLKKQIIHGLNVNQTFDDFIIFIIQQIIEFKCIIIKSNEETISNLIKALTKHYMEYYIMYDKLKFNNVVILLNLANYCEINFMRKKFKLNIENTINNNKILKIIDLLNDCQPLDSNVLSNYKRFLDQKVTHLLENANYIIKELFFILISTKDDNFYIYDTYGKENELKQVYRINNISLENISKIDYKVKLNESGCVYLWSENNNEDENTIEENETSNNNKSIIKFCTNYNSSLSIVLTRCGELYAWGKNNCGQLGTGNNFDYLEPNKIQSLENVIIIDICCGEDNCLALSNTGLMYSWGRNACGQLGVGDNENKCDPTLIKLDTFGNIKIIKILCSPYTCYALSFDGDVYCCGLDIKSNRFLKINYDENKFVNIYNCGESLLFALSTNQECFIFERVQNISTESYFIRFLIKSSLKCIHNCFFVYGSYISHYKWYKPFVLSDYSTTNDFSEYRLIQSLKENTFVLTNENLLTEYS